MPRPDRRARNMEAFPLQGPLIQLALHSQRRVIDVIAKAEFTTLHQAIRGRPPPIITYEAQRRWVSLRPALARIMRWLWP